MNTYVKLKNWCEKNINKKRKEWDAGILYAFDVFYTKKYVTCHYMKMQAFKILLYLFRGETEKDFPYFYNKKIIFKLNEIWPKLFVLTQASFKGQPFILYPNQSFKLSGYFGFRYKNNPNRTLTEYFFDIEARKQGKSEFISAISTLIATDPFGVDAAAEIYFSGPVKESSNTLFVKASRLIRYSELLATQFIRNNKVRIETYDGAYLKDIPFEAEHSEGKNFSLFVLTEYHQHPSDDLFNSANSGRNKTRNSQVIFFDTTKGKNMGGVAYAREASYKLLLDEQYKKPDEIIAPTVFAFIAELDKEDDIDNTDCWVKANPMMGITVDLDSMISEWAIAKQSVHDMNEFITKRLGKWIENAGAVLTYDDMEQTHIRWQDRYKSIYDLKGKPCFISVDLAKSNDLNAISLLFKEKIENEEIAIFSSKVFLPKLNIEAKEKRDKLPYLNWIDEGWASLSGDKAVDYADIVAYINSLRRDFDVRKILYDPYQYSVIKDIFQKTYKFPEHLFEEVPQNAKTLSAPMNISLKKIWDKQFVWFGHNHVLLQFLNVVPTEYKDQLYFSKTKQIKKIDSFATYIIGMKEWGNLPAIYNTNNGIRVWKF